MIVAAALKSESGLIFTVPKPGRHHTILQAMNALGMDRSTAAKCEQGFINEDGVFLNRKDAADHVYLVGQPILSRNQCGLILGTRDTLNWPPNLYSEDLW